MRDRITDDARQYFEINKLRYLYRLVYRVIFLNIKIYTFIGIIVCETGFTDEIFSLVKENK